MVFKRREKPSSSQRLRALIYPPGGWRRSFHYVWLRLRRLPDRPGRIARGIACGVFVCFTPFFGFHFLLAVLLAWMIQGNKMAAFFATLFGNPVTFPVIAATSIQLGEWMLQVDTPIPLGQVLGSFAQAFGEMTSNLVTLATQGSAEWEKLESFFYGVFLPYAVGGLIPGILTAAAIHALSHKIIVAYQNRRTAKALLAARKRARVADNGGSAP